MTKQTTSLWGLIQDWMDAQRIRTNQSQVADAIGVHRTAVSEWKYGGVYPAPQNLAALARIMSPVRPQEMYLQLLDAVNRDRGYLPMPEEGGGAHADSAAPNTTPQPDGAQESGKVVRPKFGSGPGAIEYDDKVPGPGESTAARDAGQLSEGHKEREAADKRGEESQDPSGADG